MIRQALLRRWKTVVLFGMLPPFAPGSEELPDGTVIDIVPAENSGAQVVVADPAAETVTLSLRGADLRAILTMFSQSRGVNIVSGGDVVGSVSIDLNEVPFDEALSAIVGMAGFEVVRKGKIYFVSKPVGTDDEASFLNEVRTYRLNYARPAAIQQVLEELLSPAGRATAYGPLRTVIIEDRPAVLTNLDAVVMALDAPPRQVMIEARIIEARLSHDTRFGIDWSLLFSDDFADGTNGEGAINVEGFATPAGSGTKGLFLKWAGGDFESRLEAMESVVDLNTLAAPKVLATDGLPAEIVIGDQLGFSVVTTVDNAVIQSVQFLDTGAQLRITPIITGDGYVMMKIHPELSNGVIDEGLPSKTTTEVSTEVLIKDGETLLIGGLIREREENTQSGIPILRSIPILGALFGSTTMSSSKSELITLITPHILEPGETLPY